MKDKPEGLPEETTAEDGESTEEPQTPMGEHHELVIQAPGSIVPKLKIGAAELNSVDESAPPPPPAPAEVFLPTEESQPEAVTQPEAVATPVADVPAAPEPEPTPEPGPTPEESFDAKLVMPSKTPEPSVDTAPPSVSVAKAAPPELKPGEVYVDDQGNVHQG
jgi:D-alanyl-D-alanine carboxypeptidase (penicillin-binding protein 5/6)